IAFTYDRKQVIQALRYHFMTRKEIRLLVIVVNLFTIAAAVLLYFKKINPLSFVFFSTLWMMLMLVLWRILPNSIYKKSQTFQDDFMMEFDESEVTLFTDRGRQIWPWSRFSKFVETPYFFHLYFDNRSFFLVPKDAFTSIPQQQEVRDLIKRKLANTKD
ncbi:MAG TPA: YcxB family protein, partial [Flavihumibacter sp.]